ncbi:hypothetical protein T265_16310, partial [Opisthorchis viverrini]
MKTLTRSYVYWPGVEKHIKELVQSCQPINNQYYFIIVDAYSKWSEVIMMDHTTSCYTVLQLTRIFCHLRHARNIGGRGFTSADFALFCQQYGVHH